jgi:hypothetical protein
MKRILTTALLASAVVFVLGMATPSVAQQSHMRANGAMNQQAYQRDQVSRHAAAQHDGSAHYGYGAYAYAPAAAPYGGCATEGTYGQGLDVSACGGE